MEIVRCWTAGTRREIQITIVYRKREVLIGHLSRMVSNLFDTEGFIPSYSPLWSESQNLYFIRFCPLLIGRILSSDWSVYRPSWPPRSPRPPRPPRPLFFAPSSCHFLIYVFPDLLLLKISWYPVGLYNILVAFFTQ